MPVPVAVPIAAGVAGIVDSIFSRNQSSKNLDKEIAYSKEAAATQHNRNIDLWRMQRDQDIDNWHMANTYNSPVNQMARLKEAGINPRLVYGSSGVSGGTATAVKSGSPNSYKYSTPNFSQVKPFQVSEGLGMYLDMKMKQAQIDAVESQTSLNHQREANEAVENAVKTAEATNADKYYKGRATKTHQEGNIKHQMMELGVYNAEVAKEKLEQERLKTKQEASRLDLTKEQVVGQKIKNDYESAGISPNTPYQARLLYKQLKSQGMEEKEVVATLLIAGVGADVLKTIVPAGILGEALKKVKGVKKPRYNSPQGWKSFENRHYE